MSFHKICPKGRTTIVLKGWRYAKALAGWPPIPGILGFLGLYLDLFFSLDFPGIFLGFWPPKKFLGFGQNVLGFFRIPGILGKNIPKFIFCWCNFVDFIVVTYLLLLLMFTFNSRYS